MRPEHRGAAGAGAPGGVPGALADCRAVPCWDQVRLFGHHSRQGGVGQGIYDVGWVMDKGKPSYSRICYLLLPVTCQQEEIKCQRQGDGDVQAARSGSGGDGLKFLHVDQDSLLGRENCALGHVPEDLPLPLILSSHPRHL